MGDWRDKQRSTADGLKGQTQDSEPIPNRPYRTTGFREGRVWMGQHGRLTDQRAHPIRRL